MITSNKLTVLILVSLATALLLSESPSKSFELRSSDQSDRIANSCIPEWFKAYQNQLVTTAALLFNVVAQPQFSPFSNKIKIRAPQELDPLPDHLRSVLKNQNNPLTLYSAQLNDYACADERNIYINRTVLEGELFSHDAQQFLVHHERAHIDNNDGQKIAFANTGIIIATPIVLNMYNHYSGKLFDYILSKLDDTSRGHTVIHSIKRINSTIASSPITQALLTFFLQGCYSRHLEKQADLTAARHTSAEAGAEFALGLQVVETRVDAHPGIIAQLSKSRLLATHPSHAERFNYLLDLAVEQSGSSKKDIIEKVKNQVKKSKN